MKELEGQVRQIIDTIPALAWSASPEGSAEFFNRRWLDYTGLTLEKAQGWGWTDALHPDDLKPLVDYWRSMLVSHVPGETEARLRRSDGLYRWFVFRATPSFDEDGNVVKWYGTNSDIDDRKRAEEALRAALSERAHLATVRAEIGMALAKKDSLQGILDLCAKAIVQNLDAAFARIWTLSRDGRELELQASAGMYTRLDGRYSRIPFGKFKIGSIAQERKPHLTNNVQNDPRVDSHDWARAEKMTSFAGYPLVVEDRVVGVMGMFSRKALTKASIDTLSFVADGIAQSIERKRAEDALKSSEQNFRLIVDNIPGYVTTLTATGEVEFVNHPIQEYFGKTLDELKEWATSGALYPDDLPMAVATWRSSLQTGQPHEIELRLRRADGVYRWHCLRRLPQRDSEGHILRWYTLHTDIHERKQAEEKLRRSEADLLEAQRLTHMGSWKHEISTGTVTVSPEIHRIFRTNPGQDTANLAFWFDRIHPEDRKRIRELFERAEIEKTEYQADYRLLLSDGTIRYQHAVGHPVMNESGELVEFVGTAMDVTEHVEDRARLEKALEEIQRLKDRLQDENLALKEEVDQASMFEEIVGTSRPLQAVLSRVVKVAPTDSSVLITGETGTGKELIARAIHKRSPRSQRAFVSVNCAALPPSLISSELFGHERGAFTGAVQRRLGRFELANGGTIFLDEVGELPPDTQIALLRILQEREFERLGGRQPIQVDVRVIAATNRDLGAATTHGNFRSDLYYRLNVFPIEVPPLRERKDDILMLLEYFVDRYAKKIGKKFGRIEKRTVELFLFYDWPGNIRELQNVVERSVIVSSGDVFRIDEAWLSTGAKRVSSRQAASEDGGQSSHERTIIEAALAECRGRVSGPCGAAAKLRIPASTLESRIRRLNIPKSRFKLASGSPR